MSIATVLHFLILAMLQIAVAQQEMVAQVGPVVIMGKGSSSCPSTEERQNSLQMLGSTVRNILASHSVPQCGGGLWHQVTYLNMSDSSQQCPSAWREYCNNTNGVRACGRPVTSIGTCPSTVYPTNHQYSRVCGRVIGYQVGSPAAFVPARDLNPSSFLEDIYVDGVSITYGAPRSHIWTFAACTTEGQDPNAIENVCPCVYDPGHPGVVPAPNSIQSSFIVNRATLPVTLH